MAISAVYSPPAGIISPTIPDSTTSLPDRSNNTEKWLPVPMETASEKNKGYNYYVVEETRETIYTEKKTAEKIHDRSGALIDIYA